MGLEVIKNIKEPKTFEEQIAILKSRNIVIDNDEEAILILKQVNYYRLSAYMLTYKTNSGNYDGVSIQDVYSLYKFDKELRSLILPMLENIEIAFRTHISYLIAHTYGALGYKDVRNFKNGKYHLKMLEDFAEGIERSDEIFVTHYRSEYDGKFPIWVSIEVISFGVLSKMYSNLLEEDKDQIAKEYYNIKGKILKTWLHSLSNIRNRCAHYGRLYNKNLTITPKLFKADKGKGISNDTVFANIYIIGRLSRDIDEWEQFIIKLKAITKQYAVVDLRYLGFPEDWEEILKTVKTVPGTTRLLSKQVAP